MKGITMFTPEEIEEMRKADAEIDAEFDTPEMKRRLMLAENSHKSYMKHRAQRLAKNKAWQKANPEKVRGYQHKWQSANQEQIREHRKEYRQEHLESVRAREREKGRRRRERLKAEKEKAASQRTLENGASKNNIADLL